MHDPPDLAPKTIKVIKYIAIQNKMIKYIAPQINLELTLFDDKRPFSFSSDMFTGLSEDVVRGVVDGSILWP